MMGKSKILTSLGIAFGYTFKKGFFVTIFWSVVISFFTAIVIWIFADVVFLAKVGFLTYWRWGVIVLAAFLYGFDYTFGLICKTMTINYLLKRFSIEPAEMKKYVDSGILTKKVRSWTDEDYRRWILIDGISGAMAKAFAKYF